MKSASERAQPSSERAIEILVLVPHDKRVGSGDEEVDLGEFLPPIAEPRPFFDLPQLAGPDSHALICIPDRPCPAVFPA
jgi:hypothetical protein